MPRIAHLVQRRVVEETFPTHKTDGVVPGLAVVLLPVRQGVLTPASALHGWRMGGLHVLRHAVA